MKKALITLVAAAIVLCGCGMQNFQREVTTDEVYATPDENIGTTCSEMKVAETMDEDYESARELYENASGSLLSMFYSDEDIERNIQIDSVYLPDDYAVEGGEIKRYTDNNGYVILLKVCCYGEGGYAENNYYYLADGRVYLSEYVRTSSFFGLLDGYGDDAVLTHQVSEYVFDEDKCYIVDNINRKLIETDDDTIESPVTVEYKFNSNFGKEEINE